MFKIYDGREEFWQWDVNQKLIVDIPCQVHFCNGVTDCSLVVETVTDEQGRHIAEVPNVLLQTARNIEAYTYICGEEESYTLTSKVFTVRKRLRPTDYVFTPAEIHTWKDLDERLQKLENASDDSNAVQYTEQEKTEAEKAQARENIGAVGEDDVTEINLVKASTAVANVTNDTDVLTPAAAQMIAKNAARFDAVYGETSYAEIDTAFNAHIPVYMRLDVTDPNNNITANVEFRLQRKQQASESVSLFHFYAEYSEVGYFVQLRNNGKWGAVTFRRYIGTINEDEPSSFNLPSEKAIVDYITAKLGGTA